MTITCTVIKHGVQYVGGADPPFFCPECDKEVESSHQAATIDQGYAALIFHCLNCGAIFMGKTDMPVAPTAWRTTVESGIAAKVAAGVIEKGFITRIDENRKLAVVEVYMFVNTELYNRLYLVFEDKGQNIKFEQIHQD